MVKGCRNSIPASVPRLGGSAGLLVDGTLPIQCSDCCCSSKLSNTIKTSRHVAWLDMPFTNASTTGQLSTKIKSLSPAICGDQRCIATKTAYSSTSPMTCSFSLSSVQTCKSSYGTSAPKTSVCSSGRMHTPNHLCLQPACHSCTQENHQS